MGVKMYNHAFVNTTVLHPANQATICGPKSRTGLKPACVNRAKTAMSPPTAKPCMKIVNKGSQHSEINFF